MENNATEEKNVYRVQGFTCTNCAAIFEKNVKNLPGVQDAQVNFGAAKVTVYGHATVEALKQAGAFENLKITPEKERIQTKKNAVLERERKFDSLRRTACARIFSRRRSW